ncbi:9931_t:CDS:2, partial [Cetraspora pellucida]
NIEEPLLLVELKYRGNKANLIECLMYISDMTQPSLGHLRESVENIEGEEELHVKRTKEVGKKSKNTSDIKMLLREIKHLCKNALSVSTEDEAIQHIEDARAKTLDKMVVLNAVREYD